MAESEGAWYPDQDCKVAYLQLEAAGAPARHRLLMNMLLLYPSEYSMDERDPDMMDFYLEKTGTVSATHLQHKLQLYNDATDEQRHDDEYMCDLTSFKPLGEPQQPGSQDRSELQPPPPNAPGAHDADIEYGEIPADLAADNVAAHIAAMASPPQEPDIDDAVVVNEGRAGSTEYYERFFDEDDDDERRRSNELWEENARSTAEERRLADELNASAAPWTNQDDVEILSEPPQPPSEPPVAAASIDAAPKTNEEDVEKPTPKPEAVPDAVRETKHGETAGAEADGDDTAPPKPPVEPPQPASELPVAAASVDAAPKINEEDVDKPTPKPEAVPDAFRETKHGETAGAEADGDAAPKPPVEPPQPASEPPIAAASVVAAPKTNEEEVDKPTPKPEAVPDAVRETKHGETAGAEADGDKTAPPKPPVEPPQPLSEPSVAAYQDAVNAYTRSTLGANSKIARRGTEGATCLNDAMALLASYCAMPTLGVSPTNPNDGCCLGWLIAHHLRWNLSGEQSKWQCAVAELAMPKYFEQEVFSGVARLRGDSPMLLVSTAVCMLKETPSSRSQTNQELPGDLINLHFMLTTRMGHAMRASVSQSVFDSATLKSAGLHPYLVVAFLQICTHQKTFDADQQWLLSNYPSLVTLLHKPVAIVMANEEPRRFLLVHVDDLLRAPTKPRPPIFKHGETAIRNLILDLIEEEKGKEDANDKMLFRAYFRATPGDTRPDGGELAPTAKLDVLSAMKWALKEFHDATYLHGPRIDTDQRKPNAVNSEPARRPEAASNPTKRLKPIPAAKRTDSPQLTSDLTSTSTASHSAVAQPGDKKRSSTIVDLFQEDESQSIQNIIAALSDHESGGSPSVAGDERELLSFVRKATATAEKKSFSEAYDHLVRKTSELINKTILGRFEKMYREFKDSPVPLQQEDLTFMTGRVNQYELSARDAVESMHEAATKYNSTYRPQVENAEKKIKTAGTKVRDAVAEAQQRLKNKRSKLSTHEPTVSHASHGAMSSLSPLNPLSPWQGALGDDAAAQVLQRAHRDALAASQRELVAQQEKVELQNKAAAELRRSEERLRDAERKSAETMEKAAVERRNAEAQALTALSKAALDLQEQVAARKKVEEAKDEAEHAAQELRDKNDRAEKEMARLREDLSLQNLRLKMEREATEREDQIRALYDAQLKTCVQEHFQLSVDNARNVASMKTKDSATMELKMYQDRLTEAMVEGATMRGAFTGYLAGGGGPSGSNNAAGMADIHSLLMGGSGSGKGSSAPPHSRELMPPPPPRPKPPPPGPHMLLKDEGNKDAAEANVPAEVQGLITELTEAETNASQAKPEPRHAEAHKWYEWKRALLKTSQDIAMHTALEEQQAKAKQYSAAEKTVAEKESMLAILAEQVTNVRALLDERRSQS